MSTVTMKQLLEAGVHFGHQSRRWNPKMKPYIYTERSKIYIVDLKKTLRLLRLASAYIRNVVADGGKVMFVGTKKQAKDIIREGASAANMYFVNNRWLGGTLTNFQTVRKSVVRMIELEKMFADGTINQYKKKEQSQLGRELESLKKNLDGIRHMDRLPQALFVIDPMKEQNAVKEARKLRIPIVAVVDTNCDPDQVDFVIPGNDDAIRSIKLMVSQMSEACVEGLAAREAPIGGSPMFNTDGAADGDDFGFLAAEQQEAAAEAAGADVAEPPSVSPAAPKPQQG